MTVDLPEAPNQSAIAVEPAAPAAEETPQTQSIETQPTGSTQTELPLDDNEPEAAPDSPELDLLDQLWTAYRSQLQASLAQQAAAIVAEKAKESYEAAKEKTEVQRAEVKSILESFCERLAAIRDPQSVAIIAQVQSAMEDDEEDQQADAPAVQEVTSMDWTEWCKIPTQTICKDIPGLGVKKAERLIAEFPTLGDLEAARTEFSKQHKHFCKALGKGFGENTADAIETAMHDLLKIPKNETKPTPSAEETAETPTQPEASPAADGSPELILDTDYSQGLETAHDAGEVYEDVDTDSVDDIYSDSLPDGTGDDDGEPVVAIHDEQYEDYDDSEEDDSQDSDDENEDEPTWADSCHLALLKDPAETKSGWGDSDKQHSEAWTKGNAAQSAWPVSACPYDESSELGNAKDWVRGWTAAAMLTLDL